MVLGVGIRLGRGLSWKVGSCSLYDYGSSNLLEKKVEGYLYWFFQEGYGLRYKIIYSHSLVFYSRDQVVIKIFIYDLLGMLLYNYVLHLGFWQKNFTWFFSTFERLQYKRVRLFGLNSTGGLKYLANPYYTKGSKYFNVFFRKKKYRTGDNFINYIKIKDNFLVNNELFYKLVTVMLHRNWEELLEKQRKKNLIFYGGRTFALGGNFFYKVDRLFKKHDLRFISKKVVKEAYFKKETKFKELTRYQSIDHLYYNKSFRRSRTYKKNRPYFSKLFKKTGRVFTLQKKLNNVISQIKRRRTNYLYKKLDIFVSDEELEKKKKELKLRRKLLSEITVTKPFRNNIGVVTQVNPLTRQILKGNDKGANYADLNRSHYVSMLLKRLGSEHGVLSKKYKKVKNGGSIIRNNRIYRLSMGSAKNDYFNVLHIAQLGIRMAARATAFSDIRTKAFINTKSRYVDTDLFGKIFDTVQYLRYSINNSSYSSCIYKGYNMVDKYNNNIKNATSRFYGAKDLQSRRKKSMGQWGRKNVSSLRYVVPEVLFSIRKAVSILEIAEFMASMAVSSVVQVPFTKRRGTGIGKCSRINRRMDVRAEGASEMVERRLQGVQALFKLYKDIAKRDSRSMSHLSLFLSKIFFLNKSLGKRRLKRFAVKVPEVARIGALEKKAFDTFKDRNLKLFKFRNKIRQFSEKMMYVLLHRWFLFGKLLNRELGLLISRKVSVEFLAIDNKGVTPAMLSSYIVKKLSQDFFLWQILKPVLADLKTTDIVKGYRMEFSGRFSRKSRSVYFSIKYGKLSRGDYVSSIDYGFRTVSLKYGACGVKVWLNKPFFHKYSILIGNGTKKL